MGLLQVTRLMPPPTFYDAGIVGSPPALSSIGTIAGWQDDLAFAALCLAYKASGGIARGDDLGRQLADHGPGTFISMAKLLQEEEVFGFEWKRTLWIPMFQFRPGDLSLKSEPRRVRAELGEEFDGWTASAWFVEPNAWLARRRPIDLLELDVVAVLHAARVDRFVAAG
jgi:hypothetical protein